MKTGTAIGISLAVGGVGAYLQNGLIVLAPLLWLGLTGLVQELVYAYSGKKHAEKIEQIPQRASAPWVAGDLEPVAHLGLERVIDPFAQADEERSETNERHYLVAGDLHIDSEGDHQERQPGDRESFVPLVDDECLKRVGHKGVSCSLRSDADRAAIGEDTDG